MKKLFLKDLVDFRRKSTRAKKTFVDYIKSTKIEPLIEGGGDYWITGLSAVSNSYRKNDLSIINEKIIELNEKLKETSRTITRNMYQRNITILETYKALPLKDIRPNDKLSILNKSATNRILTIKGLQVETKPSLIYTYGKKNEEKVGAIWFIAKIDGYRIEEVGMYSDILYRFLRHNYSKKYELSSKYSVAVDMLGGQIVSYSDIESGRLRELLSPTLDEINKLL